MDIRYIVQEGIWSPRENAYVYRDVAEVMNDRAEARRIALTYPAARVLKCTIMHEHGSRTGPEGRVSEPQPRGHTCGCGHTWSDHIRTASGAWACCCDGCACRDGVRS